MSTPTSPGIAIPIRDNLPMPERNLFTTSTGNWVLQTPEVPSGWLVDNGRKHVTAAVVEEEQSALGFSPLSPQNKKSLLYEGADGKTKYEVISGVKNHHGLRYMTEQGLRVLDSTHHAAAAAADGGWIVQNGRKWTRGYLDKSKSHIYHPTTGAKGARILKMRLAYSDRDNNSATENVYSNELFRNGHYSTILGVRVYFNASIPGGHWHVLTRHHGWVDAQIAVKAYANATNPAAHRYRVDVGYQEGAVWREQRLDLLEGLLREGCWRTESNRKVRHRRSGNGNQEPAEHQWRVNTSSGAIAATHEVVRLARVRSFPNPVIAVYLTYRLPEGFTLRERAWFDHGP